MPPKKKDKDGGKSKKSSPSGTVNAAKVSTFDASHLEQVTELLMKAKQLRNYFQLERDSVDKYWHVTLKEVENARYQLANIDQEIEHLEDRHLVEMRVYRQKVRHLLYEHKETVRSIRASAEEAEQESITRHRASLLSLRSHKGGLHGEIQSIMLEHEAQMKELREGHRLMLDRRHKNHERMMKDAQSKLENKMEVLKEELDLRRRAEIHDLEERKNAHINELLRRHETAFQEMKKYYNEITANNLDLIKCLKDEISNMKKNEEHNENLMYEIAQENKGLNTPLCDAKKAVEALRADLHNYDKDKLSLKNARNRLILLRRQHQDLCAENEALKKSFVEVEKDREDLLMRFERVLHEAKEKASRRCYNLEQRLSEMMRSSEQKDAQLTAVLSAAKLEPAAMESITRQLEDLLDTKNRAIKDLHFELRKVETTHQDVVAAYERRCAEAQLPPLDLDETLRKFRSQEN